MKLTIDTKEDSADEIKKVIHLLNMIIEGKTAEYPPASGNVLGDFFGNNENALNDLPTVTPEEKKEEVKEEDKVTIY